ncbi:MAG: T9SS type A sorting domain-containing protein [Bacteroidetes bacterium]|nr:T9SS type A sorting domain-containing protein [Bacteroidota bacterium]
MICQNLKDTQTYSLYKSPQMTYAWSCSNGFIIGSNTADSVKVDWANGGGVLQCAISINGCSNVISKNVGFSSPSLSLNMTPLILCPGDSVTLTAAGGSSQSWNKGLINGQRFLPTTSQFYTATSLDSLSCKKIDSILVTINPNPIAAIGPDLSVCAGSSLVIGLTNNIGYKYKWTPALYLSNDSISNPFCSTPVNQTYVLLVTNKSTLCKASDTINIRVNANPSPQIIGGTVICKDTIHLNVDSVFEAYNWSTNDTVRSIIVNAANTYGLTVTDKNGCSGAASKNVVNGRITNLNILGKDTICSSDSTILTANAGFSTYLWNTGSTSNSIYKSKGLYTCEVSNALGCKASDSFEVFNYPFNNIQIKVGDTLCRRDSIVIINYSSSLACNSSTVLFDGIAKSSFSLKNESKGIHAIRVSCNDKYSCKTEKIKSIYLKDCSVGISKFKSNLFAVYPNPAKDFIQLKLISNEPAAIIIRDAEGRAIQKVQVNANFLKLDISTWSNGIYMMECIQNNKSEK